MSTNDKTTFNIQNPGEKTIIGSEIVHLKDHSSRCISTDDGEQFIRLAETLSLLEFHPGEDQKNFLLFFSESGAEAWAIRSRQDLRYQKPLATLSLGTHPRLERIHRILGQNLSMQDSISFLKAMRDNLNAEGMKLLMHAHDFRVSRKSTFEEVKNTDGTGTSIRSTNDSKIENDFTPPASVQFTVPIYSRIPLLVELDLDFEVVIVGEGDKAKPYFRFTAPNLSEDLTKARKAIITSWFTTAGDTEKLSNAVAPDSFVWGTRKIVEQDDSWSLFQNRFDGVESLK